MMNKRVLVVEDEESVAKLLEAGLKREGFDVSIAFDGEAAKEKILKIQPEVVLLDLIMPRLDGWEVLSWLRKEQKSKIPVIIVSAKDEMNSLKKGYDLEADYYMIKPISVKGLIKGINTIFSVLPKADSPAL